MSTLHYLSIAEAASRIRGGGLTASTLVEACLARIAAVDGKLNSFVTLTAEQARADAARADAEIAAGRWRGPLHGIPIGLKDIYATAGVRTTCNSRLLLENVPTSDAESVARLKAAGAIVLGKLATHEFAFGSSLSDPPLPSARNPWNLDHIPSGSSSGSGAALAAGLVAGATGSDTGGSIRGPSGFCGIAGIKPTYGLVSRRGVYPLSWTLDHAGPMARTVEDCAILLQAMAGHDPDDPASVDTPIPDYRAALEQPVRGMKVGVARAFYTGADRSTPETVAAIDAALAVLADLGVTVKDVDLPDIRDYGACGRIILLSEAYTIHREHLAKTPELYGQQTRDRVRLAAFLSSADYIAALRWRRRLIEQTLAAMAGVDAIVTANHHAPADTFAAATAVTFHFFGKPSLTMPFNVTGLPALTVRCDFSANGLPLAFQIAGRPFEDATVLRLGHAYERARGDFDRRPPI